MTTHESWQTGKKRIESSLEDRPSSPFLTLSGLPFLGAVIHAVVASAFCYWHLPWKATHGCSRNNTAWFARRSAIYFPAACHLTPRYVVRTEQL